eukprot:4829066-Pyramimonas_sp.AAC.1
MAEPERQAHRLHARLCRSYGQDHGARRNARLGQRRRGRGPSTNAVETQVYDLRDHAGAAP